MGSLEDLDKAFAALEKQFPEARRELVEDAGVIMYERVTRNIDAETKEQSGRLREACHLVIGSGGGYAAVRNDNRKAPHAQLVEFGHRLIKDAKTKEGKHGRRVNIKGSGKLIGWVNGKHMYRNALNEVEEEIVHKAGDMVDKLVGDKF